MLSTVAPGGGCITAASCPAVFHRAEPAMSTPVDTRGIPDSPRDRGCAAACLGRKQTSPGRTFRQQSSKTGPHPRGLYAHKQNHHGFETAMRRAAGPPAGPPARTRVFIRAGACVRAGPARAGSRLARQLNTTLAFKDTNNVLGGSRSRMRRSSGAPPPPCRRRAAHARRG